MPPRPRIVDQMEVNAWGSAEMHWRPCVDCGAYTGNFCETMLQWRGPGLGRHLYAQGGHCSAAERMPNQEWSHGQSTPLCVRCEHERGACHFCRGVRGWTEPLPWGNPNPPNPGDFEEMAAREVDAETVRNTLQELLTENAANSGIDSSSPAELQEFMEEADQCVICMARIRDMRAQCGHMFACSACIRRVNHCAICRQRITAVYRVQRNIGARSSQNENDLDDHRDAETFSNPESVAVMSDSDVQDAGSYTSPQTQAGSDDEHSFGTLYETREMPGNPAPDIVATSTALIIVRHSERMVLRTDEIAFDSLRWLDDLVSDPYDTVNDQYRPPELEVNDQDPEELPQQLLLLTERVSIAFHMFQGIFQSSGMMGNIVRAMDAQDLINTYAICWNQCFSERIPSEGIRLLRLRHGGILCPNRSIHAGVTERDYYQYLLHPAVRRSNRPNQ